MVATKLFQTSQDLVARKLVNVFRPTKSTVVNFPHNSDSMLKLSSIGLRAKRSDNFIPRVMRKRLRANFHNFVVNFATLTSREPSRRPLRD